MQAMVYKRYGPPDVLQLQEVAAPVPADGEVRIRICAASVNPLDWHIMRGEPFFVRFMTGLAGPKHKILGSDFAGRVDSVGAGVTQFRPGDEVYGANGTRGGAFAEYVCAAARQVVPKPANLSFEEAAAVPVAALTALQGLRDKGRIQPGQQVLIDGASGGVGTFAIQIAKALGGEVTAVCSTRNLARAHSLGADQVIDYTRENFTRSGSRYHLILAANASHSIFDYRRALAPDGIYVGAGGKASVPGMLQGVLLAPVLSRFGRKKMGGFLARFRETDFAFLNDLLQTRKVVPVIDRRYAFPDTPAAIRYLEEGHAQGKVVITMPPTSPE